MDGIRTSRHQMPVVNNVHGGWDLVAVIINCRGHARGALFSLTDGDATQSAWCGNRAQMYKNASKALVRACRTALLQLDRLTRPLERA